MTSEFWTKWNCWIFVQVLGNTKGTPYDPTLLTQKALANIINQLVFSRRFVYQDQQLTEMVESLEEALEILANSGAVSMYPWLTYLPGDLFEYKRLIHLRDIILGHIAKIYNDHK